MVKSVLKKSPPFKSYSKNSELPSKKFLIKMSIFVLQRYLCYEFWAMCYEVFFMCYVSRPKFFVTKISSLIGTKLQNNRVNQFHLRYKALINSIT